MGTRLLFIVEDQDGTRTALRGLFHRMGFEVIAVDPIAEGLVALDMQPDYAVVDLPRQTRDKDQGEFGSNPRVNQPTPATEIVSGASIW